MIIVNARFLTQPITGVQRYAIEISCELKKMLSREVLFVAPSRIIQQEYAKELNAIAIGKHTGHLWEQWDLPQYLKKQGDPLLLCLCNTAPLFYRNKIVTVHDVAFEAYPQTFSRSFLYAYRFMIPRIMRSAKKVITVSEFSKDEIVKYYGVDRDKVSVVYNAVSSRFRHEDDERLRKQKYLLAVSSLNYRKNFFAVLEAFAMFEKEDREAVLYIIGGLDNSNFAGIDIGRYKDDPRIHFLGRISDDELVRYYSNAAAFIYPSIYEGFGIPPLEAQACGCPVVVANIPPLREVVADSGVYCNPFDVKDIARQIANAVAGSEELSVKGYANGVRFSWETSAKKVGDLVREYQ